MAVTERQSSQERASRLRTNNNKRRKNNRTHNTNSYLNTNAEAVVAAAACSLSELQLVRSTRGCARAALIMRKRDESF